MNEQETIAGVSQNSNECDNPDRMQKSVSWYGQVQNKQGSGVQLKESVGQSSFVPHGKQLHNSTFNPQPVAPSISLSHIQKNILSHSDLERRRFQYDNAWNILENGDSRLSNLYRPSVTTKKQLNTSYVFVGSVQETSREVKSPPTPSSGLTDDTSRYSGDTEDYKSKPKKPCSMKKICKYILWIFVFIGILAVVAISTVNYQNSQTNHSNSMEAQRDGNNDINKTHTSVLEKLDSIKKSIESIKAFSEESNTYVNTTNLPNQSSPGYSNGGSRSDSGVQCNNSTNDGCVKDCTIMCDGDYQSCETCEGYVSCFHENLNERNCSMTSIILFWDDELKACEHKSSTCNVS